MLPIFYYLWTALNFWISHAIATQDFHSTPRIPGLCSLLKPILLHPVSTRSALNFLYFTPVPPGLGAPGHCCCSCLEPSRGSSGAAPPCAAECCPQEVFWDADMLFVWYQPPQTRLIQGECPPHQFRPTLFLFPFVLTQKYEVEILGISTPMVFLLLSWLVFHCFPISVQGLLCLHCFFCCLSVSLPSSMTERKIARGEGIIVWFKVISADFFQQCAEQSQLLLSSVGMETTGPSQTVLCTCQNRAQRNHIYCKLFWMAAVKQLEKANALASGSNFTCLQDIQSHFKTNHSTA